MKKSLSLPVWEEWIEIHLLGGDCVRKKSLPVWEEWIEITSIIASNFDVVSRPVWEEWIEIFTAPLRLSAFRVSSRMGRVD